MTGRVDILIVSGQHSFSGAVENRGLRILDVLNEPSTEFLNLHNVSIQRGFDETSIQHVGATLLPKAAVDFVLLKSEPHEAPIRRKHSLVAKDRYSALVVLDHYEIRGTFVAKGAIEPKMVLRNDASDFFAIVSPTINWGGNKGAVSAGVAFVNKAKVSLFHYGFEKSASQPVTLPMTQFSDSTGFVPS
jgi:hypothetical protein